MATKELNTMTPITELQERYYSMSEAIALTGLPISTIRYWESQFDQLNPRKDGHGNRYFSKNNVQLLRQIKHIRDELKITRIDAIRRELESNDKQTDSKQKAIEILGRLREELVEIRKYL